MALGGFPLASAWQPDDPKGAMHRHSVMEMRRRVM
jgi:hypothetical protein